MAADNAAATSRAARWASALSCLRAPARASRTRRPANGSHRSRCSSGIAAAGTGPLPDRVTIDPRGLGRRCRRALNSSILYVSRLRDD